VVLAALTSLLISCVGYYAEKFGITSVSFCITHAALAGASVGIALEYEPTYAAMVLAVLSAVTLGAVLPRIAMKDVLILSLFSFFSALALMAIYLSNTSVLATSSVSMILWGSLLAVDLKKILSAAIILFTFTLYLRIFRREIESIIFDRELAEAEGVDVYLHTLILLVFMGIAIAMTLRITGGFLIFSLLYLPVASSLMICDVARIQLVIAMSFALFSSLLGILISYLFDLPVGSSITIMATLLLLFSSFIRVLRDFLSTRSDENSF